jgi:hypothetical protein
MSWFASFAVVLAALLGTAAPASAQGNGKSKGKDKHYEVTSGKAVTVTRTVLEERGYQVVRVERVGGDRVIYYRRGNNGRGKGKGPLEKLVIRSVKNRVVFEEAVPEILIDIDIRLRP